MIGFARTEDSDRHASQVENNLVRFRPLLVMPEALDQGCAASHYKGFREGQFDDAEQDKDEEYGKSPCDGRKRDLHAGGQDCQNQITEEAREVL